MTQMSDEEKEQQIIGELINQGASDVTVDYKSRSGDYEAVVSFENGSSCMGHGSSRLDALHNARGAMTVHQNAGGAGFSKDAEA